jgi:hypothetical protein
MKELRLYFILLGRLPKLLVMKEGEERSKIFEIKLKKHSGHFSRFRIIIGNFCIVNQKFYVLKLINYIYLCFFFKVKYF